MSPTFLVLAIVLFVLWCALLALSRRTRREQLIMSLVGLAVAPAVLFIAARGGSGLARIVGVEDFVFAASFFGVAAVIYEAAFGQHLVRMERVRAKETRWLWMARLFLYVCVWVAVSVVCFFLLGLPLLRALLASVLITGVYLIAERKDLLGNALASGAFMAALVLISEWLFAVRLHPDGISVLRVAISLNDVVWAAVVGCAIGPLYEYVRHLKQRS